MSIFHLGAEADEIEPFDPAPALAAEGMPIPQPIDVDYAPGRGKSSAFVGDRGLAIDTSATDGQFDGPYPMQVRGINPKDALGLAKPDLSVVPPASLLHLASAMMDGANKYGPFNWRENKVLARVYVAAAQRHLLQFLDGEDYDPTSKVHHLGHAMACCAIVLDAMETDNLSDNRPVPGAAGEMIRRWSSTEKFS